LVDVKALMGMLDGADAITAAGELGDEPFRERCLA
jgi:hypothetical protein